MSTKIEKLYWKAWAEYQKEFWTNRGRVVSDGIFRSGFMAGAKAIAEIAEYDGQKALMRDVFETDEPEEAA